VRYAVLLTADAERDLEELYDYIADHDSRTAAEHVLDRLLEATASLATDPKRGTIPKELRELGLQEFRQAFFKPYRVIYRLADREVYVLVVADGRRELSLLLARRLLGAGERG
jgi:toxin ParE1/3/4